MTKYVILGVALIAVGMFFTTVKANPSQIYRDNPSTPTTTVTYMTPGAATTTNSFNTIGDGGFEPDTAVFTECLNASTTATVLNTSFEYSYDGVTWFANNLASSTGGVASVGIVTPGSLSWAFASTSIGGNPVLATNNSGCKIVTVSTPVQYIRAVMSLTGAAGSVWSDFAAKRQMR